jgi:hypothetical protein
MMKRIAVAFAGLLYGLVLTFLCLYVLSRIQWTPSKEPARGCHEIGKCPITWWEFLLLLVDIFGSSILFALLNFVAWRRWSPPKLAFSFVALTILTVAYRVSGYVLH